MKIAQVVCTLPPYGGGIGVVTHFYAQELTKLGHEVVVFVPSRKKGLEIKPNYTIVKLIPWFRVGNAAALPQLLWRLRRFDVIHLHAPLIGASFFVYLLKLIRRQKMKLVLSYHMDLVGAGVKKILFNIYNILDLKNIVKCSDKIIVSSFDYTTTSYLEDYFNKEKYKFVEIPFGVRKAFNPEKKNPGLLNKYELSQNDTIIGFVGGLDSAHYFKGVEYLITAISKIENLQVKAIIVGEGNLKKKYQETARKMGVKDRVIFTGYVEKKLLPDHYNLFDIFVLPSVDRSEAFGLVLLEAMACGKPLIASNLKGVRSVVIPGENGLLVEPKNARDIANKINYLLANPTLMTQFSTNGTRIINQKYRWPIIAMQVEQVYKSIK